MAEVLDDPRPLVLVVDDDLSTRQFLELHLEEMNARVILAETGKEAISALESGGIDLVLLDYVLPDLTGLEVLEQVKRLCRDAVVVVMTAHSNVQNAVEMMKEGAFHYTQKPLDLADILEEVAQATESARLRREVKLLRAARAQPYALDQLIGKSKAIEEVKSLLEKLSRNSSSTVLITGESGTGKDLAAKILHYNSDRAGGPFTNITCSALPDTLLESQLFGYERGAFTDAKESRPGLFEIGHKGTVFLDEIGDMALALQAKLLRFLEERAFLRVGGSKDVRVDVRVIAATNRNLEEAVRDGRFRSDLFYRLCVFPLEVPPLRDREGDIPLLARFYLDRFNRESGRSVREVHPDTLRKLEAYHWPGNIRELKNAIERAVLLSDRPILDDDDFVMLGPARAVSETFRLPPQGVRLEDLERALVEQALERSEGNQTKAGKLLGINRDQVRYRVEKFALDLRRYSRSGEK
ncbi:MAG: sigma-54-dependent Fis family transcriptional regulator [Deltaproteobacteria bacterium]|nr:sigma-54-dependent Fis family transcriptional regulator [Deltaproteobacteria bacterium]